MAKPGEFREPRDRSVTFVFGLAIGVLFLVMGGMAAALGQTLMAFEFGGTGAAAVVTAIVLRALPVSKRGSRETFEIHTRRRLVVVASILLLLDLLIFFMVASRQGTLTAAIETGVIGAIVVLATVIGWFRFGSRPPT